MKTLNKLGDGEDSNPFLVVECETHDLITPEGLCSDYDIHQAKTN